MSNLDQKIPERTGGTKRTFSDNVPINGSPEETIEGTTATEDFLDGSDFELEVISPHKIAPEILMEPDIKRPGFMVYDDYFSIEGHFKPAGLYPPISGKLSPLK